MQALKKRFVQLRQAGLHAYRPVAVVEAVAPPPNTSDLYTLEFPNVQDDIFQMLYFKGEWVSSKSVLKRWEGTEPYVRWVGQVLDGAGYGAAARHCVAALDLVGVATTVKEVSHESARADYGYAGRIVKSLIGKKIPYGIVVLHQTPENYQLYREVDRFNVGVMCWETDRFPANWVVQCNQMNELWLPCEWTADVARRSGVRVPIRIIGYPVDFRDFEGVSEYKISNLPTDVYKFYSIFQWSERKNPSCLLEAYLSEFTKSDPVVLIVKTYLTGYSVEEQRCVRRMVAEMRRKAGPKAPRIVVISRMLSTNEVWSLHKLGDCFVLPHRSEGWGMPHLEACMVGNPVITTAFGGNLEFTRPEHSYLLDPGQLVPVTGMERFRVYDKTMRWGNPSVDQCRQLMRHVFENRHEATQRGKAAQEYVRKNLSWEAVGMKMKAAFQEIWAGLR
jgi:glycosyltransferase involved in cell wall biosynthesis